ncbi:MAG TPA: alanine racemase [Humisphaera sp.]|jgi:D-serine deaminase-like pyridoxal phosphate-dependent protein|nr:alanine racemase [Humisphaera sp.]
MTDTPATPFISIDVPTLKRNVQRMAAYTREHRLGLRPHTKTHKSTRLAHMQMEAGAIGLTVAKPGEAQVMADACDDLLMAYPAFDSARARLLAQIAQKKTVRVAVDSPEAADAIAQAARAEGATIGILVDLDVGHHRTGVQSAGAALELAQHIDRSQGLRLDGLMFFPGHLSASAADLPLALRGIDEYLGQILDRWRNSGLEAKVISGGSTPTAYSSHLISQLTEVRPGTYVFNDMNCVHGKCATLDDCAARIISTVISTAVPGQIVLDAGSKTLTSDRCGPARDSGHGYIVEYPQAKITKLSEEHAQVDVSKCDRVPKVGQRVSVIPNHICPCINLQDRVWWNEDGSLDQVAVDARGKVF